MTLREEITQIIRREGPIPFSRYMSLCLYHPQLGYYSRAHEKFGKTGDFYTSSDVHAVFGRLLARQFDEMWRCMGAPNNIDIIELGPGRGLFAQDVLDWSARKFADFSPALRYRLVESSPALRERLQSNFASRRRVEVFGTLEDACQDASENVIVFANEFFDAMPVELLTKDGEIRVDERENRFLETIAPASGDELEYMDRYAVLPEEGERIEAALQSNRMAQSIAEFFGTRRGFGLFVDYGYTREEMLAGRHRGTVMTYRAHRATPDPYEAPGEQDITAHVNFSALRAVAQNCGIMPLGLVTQSQMLIGIGQYNEFADAFEDCVLPQERAKVTLQLKHLITPAGMGESFQALFLGSGIAKEKAARLSGLSFAH